MRALPRPWGAPRGRPPPRRGGGWLRRVWLRLDRAAHAQPQLLLEEGEEEGARTLVQLLKARLVRVRAGLRVGVRVREL